MVATSLRKAVREWLRAIQAGEDFLTLSALNYAGLVIGFLAMRPRRHLTLMLAFLLVAGCARVPRSTVAVPPPAIPVAAYAPVETNQPYRLGSGDRLRIVVFGQEGLSNIYAVDPNGSVTMPLIGSVPARGLTANELAQSIAGRLRQGYIREPHVAVEIEAYRPFFILGEVTAPGQYPYVAKMTVEQAVAVAGGFAPRAWKGPVEIRRMLNGAIVRIPARPIDLICPGDTLIIAERWF
jgi:polysaccharide export outer membrane protein